MANDNEAVRAETTVNAPLESVWSAWTTSEGAETFFARTANIELRLGGSYEIFFNPADLRMSTKGRRVLSYEPKRMVCFEWNPLDADHARVTITQLGMKSGPVWDRATRHIERGWSELARRLKGRFDTGPIDWSSQMMMWKERAGTSSS